MVKVESPSTKSLTEIGPMLLEKTVFKFCQCIFRYYLPLEMDRALLLNKLEFPSRTDALCQVWLIYDPWFWEEDFKISSMYLFRYFLRKGALHLDKLEFQSFQDALNQVQFCYFNKITI